MKKAYIEVSQERLKSLLKELPRDAIIYGLEIEPKTGSIRIYFVSEEVPDTDEKISAPFYFVSK